METNILGIDYGSVRVGLALGSTETKRAEPYVTLMADSELMGRLQKVISDQSIKEVVVGLPRNLDGDDTGQTKLARRFAADLEEITGLPIHLQDEALTSEAAKKQLLEQSSKKSLSKGVIDRVAAAIILQDYLDSL